MLHSSITVLGTKSPLSGSNSLNHSQSSDNSLNLPKSPLHIQDSADSQTSNLISGGLALIPEFPQIEDNTLPTQHNQKRSKLIPLNSNCLYQNTTSPETSVSDTWSSNPSKVEISRATDTMQQNRNKIYSLKRSVNGNPMIYRQAKASSVIITEINEDSPSPKTKPTVINDPGGSLE